MLAVAFGFMLHVRGRDRQKYSEACRRFWGSMLTGFPEESLTCLPWKGRTVRQVILGGYGFGAGATMAGFIILGNYSMGMQLSGAADFLPQYRADGDLYGLVISIINTMPCP